MFISLFLLLKIVCFLIEGAKMDANGEIMYALKYAGAVCKMVSSSEMIAKCPEKLVPFLESMIVFNWPDRSTSNNAVDVGNYAYISACTNNGGGIKYLLSRNDNRFLHVATSNNMLNHAPDVVVRFLESKIDFNDTGHPLPQTRNFSKFFCFFKIYFYSTSKFRYFNPIFKLFRTAII